VGATVNPNVVISERSTGCEFTLHQGQALPGGSCGRVNPANGTVVAGSTSAGSTSGVRIGPVSVGPSGVRVSGVTTAASRDYYTRLTRPIVSLQLGKN
jgi:hypothetical protein